MGTLINRKGLTWRGGDDEKQSSNATGNDAGQNQRYVPSRTVSCCTSALTSGLATLTSNFIYFYAQKY
jgi:hypothetical protein